MRTGDDGGGGFEGALAPHLDAAYNLARWIVRDDHDAEDVVQDACLRAFRFRAGFRGDDARGWLLTIVRNASYSWLRKRRPDELAVTFDEEDHGGASMEPSPEAETVRRASGVSIQRALEALPVGLRETIVLREIEGLSYAEIAAVTDAPIGTVMSRLARARSRLRASLTESEESR